eukprot:67726-Chlamydomonas_euryale.AAC.1
MSSRWPFTPGSVHGCEEGQARMSEDVCVRMYGDGCGWVRRVCMPRLTNKYSSVSTCGQARMHEGVGCSAKCNTAFLERAQNAQSWDGHKMHVFGARTNTCMSA